MSWDIAENKENGIIYQKKYGKYLVRKLQVKKFDHEFIVILLDGMWTYIIFETPSLKEAIYFAKTKGISTKYFPTEKEPIICPSNTDDDGLTHDWLFVKGNGENNLYRCRYCHEEYVD